MSSFNPSKNLTYQFPMPSGEPLHTPKTFDEVPPVVAVFFRHYMGVGDTWFERVSGSKCSPIYLFGHGCSRGGSEPYQKNWLNLVRAPVLGYDESPQDLSGATPYDVRDFRPILFNSSRFPQDLKDALVLVAKKDLEVLKKWKEELLETNHSENTMLCLMDRIERIERNSDIKPYLQSKEPKKSIRLKP